MKFEIRQQPVYKALLGFFLFLFVAVAAVDGQVNLEGESPIDIETRAVVFTRHLPPLGFNYRPDAYLDIVNTGSPDEFATIRANVGYGAGSLQVDGKIYNLVQFHWHTESEHLINGRSYPLEMHLVHQAQDGSILVVGVFIKRGRPHQELGKIFSQLPGTEFDTATIGSFDLNLLLPRYHESFRYSGSLTTPPFTRGVEWVVLTQPIELSNNQIRAFKRIFPEGNTREAQPLGGRVVTTDSRFFD